MLVLLFASLYGKSQDTLSSRHYYEFSYKIKPGIKLNDPASIAAAFTGIADQLFTDSKTFTEKPLKDSAILTEVYYSLIYASLYKKDFKHALMYIDKSRKLNYLKKFTAPPFLLEKAFAQASLMNTGEAGFKTDFAKLLTDDFRNIDAAFIKDVANQLKGSYTMPVAETYDKNVKEYINSALQQDSMVIMYNMPYIMKLFFIKQLIISEQELIQNALNKLSPEQVEMQSVQIPMRDGIKLGGLLFRNIDAVEKVPAIIAQSPYPSGDEAKYGNIFSVNGYAYLYVDCRGRGSSEGEFFPYENDSRDYYDIIEWASKQPWCSGQVATTGGSYLGFTQWQAIRKENRHPALKAINPMAAVGFGVDFPRNFQSFNAYALQWAAYVDGKEINSALFDNTAFWKQKRYELYKNNIPFSKFDSVAGIKNKFFTKWLQHPDFDYYWTNILPRKADYAQLDIPVLTTTGYYDGDQNGALFYYRNHVKYNRLAKHYIIMGPFDHEGSQWMPKAIQAGTQIEEEALIPLYKLVIQWFDWALKGRPLPAFFNNKVNYYVTGKQRWQSVPALNNITGDSLFLFIAPDSLQKNNKTGTLTKTVNLKESVFTYSHDITSAEDSLRLFSPQSFNDMDSFNLAFNHGLVFQSAPLEKDIIISGRMSAHLFAGLNVPDADIMVIYFEVDEAGNEQYVAHEMLRTRYRNDATHPQLMKPNHPTLLHFNKGFIHVQKIKKGSTFKMMVLIGNEMGLEKNYGFGGEVSKESSKESRMIELSIYTGRKYKSYFAIPIQ